MKGEEDSPGVSEHERSGWIPTMSISLSRGVLYLQPATQSHQSEDANCLLSASAQQGRLRTAAPIYATTKMLSMGWEASRRLKSSQDLP